MRVESRPCTVVVRLEKGMLAVKRPVPNRPRKIPRQERSKVTVETILEATARVLAREGYERATTNRIAEVSGYSVGSLYDYFPNKESLVAALIERHAEEMVAAVESSFRVNADYPLPVAVRSWVESGVRAHSHNPGLHNVLVEQVSGVGDSERIGEFEERITRSVKAYLERHAGEIEPQDLSLASFVVVQADLSLTHKAVAERPGSLEDGRLVDEVTSLVVGYLAPDHAE